MIQFGINTSMSWKNLLPVSSEQTRKGEDFPKIRGTWRRTVWYKYFDILEELTAIVFRTEEERGRFPQTSWEVTPYNLV